MSGGGGVTSKHKGINPDKLYVLAEFKHYQKHVSFTMEGAGYKSKIMHDGVKVLIAVMSFVDAIACLFDKCLYSPLLDKYSFTTFNLNS